MEIEEEWALDVNEVEIDDGEEDSNSNSDKQDSDEGTVVKRARRK